MAFEIFLERGSLLAVENRVVNEVGRSFGLVGADEVDKGLAAHGLQSVVEAALLADGGNGGLADGFAAE